jgi:hypothetical protein
MYLTVKYRRTTSCDSPALHPRKQRNRQAARLYRRSHDHIRPVICNRFYNLILLPCCIFKLHFLGVVSILFKLSWATNKNQKGQKQFPGRCLKAEFIETGSWIVNTKLIFKFKAKETKLWPQWYVHMHIQIVLKFLWTCRSQFSTTLLCTSVAWLAYQNKRSARNAELLYTNIKFVL